jgi:hypothetical protein
MAPAGLEARAMSIQRVELTPALTEELRGAPLHPDIWPLRQSKDGIHEWAFADGGLPVAGFGIEGTTADEGDYPAQAFAWMRLTKKSELYYSDLAEAVRAAVDDMFAATIARVDSMAAVGSAWELILIASGFEDCGHAPRDIDGNGELLRSYRRVRGGLN